MHPYVTESICNRISRRADMWIVLPYKRWYVSLKILGIKLFPGKDLCISYDVISYDVMHLLYLYILCKVAHIFS